MITVMERSANRHKVRQKSKPMRARTTAGTARVGTGGARIGGSAFIARSRLRSGISTPPGPVVLPAERQHGASFVSSGARSCALVYRIVATLWCGTRQRPGKPPWRCHRNTGFVQ